LVLEHPDSIDLKCFDTFLIAVRVGTCDRLAVPCWRERLSFSTTNEGVGAVGHVGGANCGDRWRVAGAAGGWLRGGFSRVGCERG
jgi:hypothetical protein